MSLVGRMFWGTIRTRYREIPWVLREAKDGREEDGAGGEGPGRDMDLLNLGLGFWIWIRDDWS